MSRGDKPNQWDVGGTVWPKWSLPGSFGRLSTELVFLDLTAMAEQQQFYLLLGNLMSPDNTVRKQAEVSKCRRFHGRGAVNVENRPFALAALACYPD